MTARTLLSSAAEPLRADVILFLNPETPGQPVLKASSKPDDRRAIALDDTAGLQQAGIKLMPENEFGLARQWSALKAKPGYEGLLKLSFVQAAPAESGGPAIKLFQPVGDGGGLYGWLRLNSGKGGKASSLQAELEYLVPVEGGVQVHRLKQRRAAGKDGSILYLDGGRLGLLVKLGKLNSAVAARQ